MRKIGWRVDCVHRYRLSETFFASFYPGKKRFIRLSKDYVYSTGGFGRFCTVVVIRCAKKDGKYRA
ncbi:hypothetical protein OCV46_14425 [Anthropogastromicrobium aceti]|nr:hypothetical protein [Anthropogastromicrobium aceti]